MSPPSGRRRQTEPGRPARIDAGGGQGLRLPRRILGALVLLLALAPGYLILAGRPLGPFGDWVLDLEAQSTQLILWGSVICLGGGAVFALLVRPDPIRRTLRRVGDALAAPPTLLFAVGCGVVTMLLSVGASHVMFRGFPSNVDGIASLLQARFLAHGHAGGPDPEFPAARIILNTLVTPHGWVSLYPAFHPALLAVGLLLGAPWMVGPVMAGVAVTFSGLAAVEALPGRPRTARLGVVLAALSPFMILLGGSYLSHTTAAAGIALAAWTGLRARRGGWGWAVASGAAMGVAVSARPWTGLVACSGILVFLWLEALDDRERGAGWLTRRAGAALLGGLPFALALFAYDSHFFGSPFRLGYIAAYGPAHQLGFHADPWGYPYGLREAVGYTASDLTALSSSLLETPIPAVGLVGLFLVVARSLPAGSGLFLVWGLLPVAGNFFYWHHGFDLGPRMLYEAAPAWCVLVALAATGLAGSRTEVGGLRADESSRGERRGRERREGGAGASPRLLSPEFLGRVALGALLLSLLGPVSLVPVRLTANRWPPSTLARMRAPIPAGEGRSRALVFVHGSWSERVSAKLQASGIRMDSLELALRRNDLCLVDAYARARRAGAAALPDLDFRPEPGAPPSVRLASLPGGTRIRRDPRLPFPSRCKREVSADRLGTVPLAPLLWQGHLPGIDGQRPLYARDMGPEENQRLIDAHPDRTPWMFAPEERGGAPVLQPYGEAVKRLWSDGRT